MSRSTKITAGVLFAMLLGVLGALMMEASAGPTFRPQDYADYRECMRNIPSEWGPGSLQRSGAEDACMYVHLRR